MMETKNEEMKEFHHAYLIVTLCVAVTQFRKDGLLPEWLNTMFVQIFVYSYVWAKHTVYLYPVIGSALRLLNVPAQQKPVCKDV